VTDGITNELPGGMNEDLDEVLGRAMVGGEKMDIDGTWQTDAWLTWGAGRSVSAPAGALFRAAYFFLASYASLAAAGERSGLIYTLDEMYGSAQRQREGASFSMAVATSSELNFTSKRRG